MGVGEVTSIRSEIHHCRALSIKYFSTAAMHLWLHYTAYCVGILVEQWWVFWNVLMDECIYPLSSHAGHYRGVKDRLCTPGPEWLQSQAVPDVHCQLRWSGWEGPGECLGNIDINLMDGTYHSYASLHDEVPWWQQHRLHTSTVSLSHKEEWTEHTLLGHSATKNHNLAFSWIEFE